MFSYKYIYDGLMNIQKQLAPFIHLSSQKIHSIQNFPEE